MTSSESVMARDRQMRVTRPSSHSPWRNGRFTTSRPGGADRAGGECRRASLKGELRLAGRLDRLRGLPTGLAEPSLGDVRC